MKGDAHTVIQLSAFADIVRQTRKRKGFTQDELAKRSGLNRAYISDVERGERNISLGALFSLASGLAVPPSELLTAVETEIATNPAKWAVPAAAEAKVPAGVEGEMRDDAVGSSV